MPMCEHACLLQHDCTLFSGFRQHVREPLTAGFEVEKEHMLQDFPGAAGFSPGEATVCKIRNGQKSAE